MSLTRRELLAAALAGAASGCASAPQEEAASAAPPLPLGDDLLLRGGLLCEPGVPLPRLRRADLRVRAGEIVEIGAELAAGASEVIDVTGQLVLPGFVDAHFHLWNSLARGFDRSSRKSFFPTMKALAAVWTPEASALSVELGLAAAVRSGITTVNNWAHNVASPEFAAAELRAQRAAGVRGRFSCGYPQSLTPDRVMDLGVAAELRGETGPLLDLGLAARGPDRTEDAVWRAEWSRARELGLPLTCHIASSRKAAAQGGIRKLAGAEGLGPDVLLVHATYAAERDYALLRESATPLALSPWTEMQVGYGLPSLPAMLAAEVPLCLSVDNLVLSGRADMFAVTRLTADLIDALGEAQDPRADALALSWAIGGGARALGLGERVGALEVGRRADLVTLQQGLGADPTPTRALQAVLRLSAPADVRTVLINGALHLYQGRLTRVDEAELQARAEATLRELCRKAGLGG